MHTVKNEQTPQIFTVFSVTNNKYDTQSCRGRKFSKILYKSKTTQYNISLLVTYLWNSLIQTELKDLTFQYSNQKSKLCV